MISRGEDTTEREDYKNRHIKGLELSRAFFNEYGRTMLEKTFPELGPRAAAGLIGHGSECLGYDDNVSEDHDFEAGFCIWLSDEDFEKYGFKLFRAYEGLPVTFMGYERKKTDLFGRSRKGVFSRTEFFRELTGCPEAPKEPMDWFLMPEYALCEAANGEVFYDPSGDFTRLREGFSSGYPRDVLLKKIAARAVFMAQSGQYNYIRCLRHGEKEAAALALSEFIDHSMAMIFLLNRRYMPYYKWSFRMLKELPRLCEAVEILSDILLLPREESFIKNDIERVCFLVAGELKKEGMSDSDSDYLETHALAVTDHIEDPRIKGMHLMEGI